MENTIVRKKRIVRRKKKKPPSTWDNNCDPTDELGDQLARKCKEAKDEYKQAKKDLEEAKEEVINKEVKQKKLEKNLWIHQTYRAMCECEDTFYTHMGILYDFIKIMDDSTDEHISKENIKRLHKLSALTGCEVCLFPYEL